MKKSPLLLLLSLCIIRYIVAMEDHRGDHYAIDKVISPDSQSPYYHIKYDFEAEKSLKIRSRQLLVASFLKEADKRPTRWQTLPLRKNLFSEPVKAVVTSEDIRSGRYYAAISEDFVAKYHQERPYKGKVQACYRASSILSCAHTPGKPFALATLHNEIKLIQSFFEERSEKFSSFGERLEEFSSGSHSAGTMAFQPGTNIIAYGGFDMLCLHDIKTNELIDHFEISNNPTFPQRGYPIVGFYSLDFNENSVLATGGSAGITLFDTRCPLRTVKQHFEIPGEPEYARISGACSRVRFGKNNPHAIGALGPLSYLNTEAYLLDTRRPGEIVKTISDYEDHIKCITMASGYLATGLDSGIVRLFDESTGEEMDAFYTGASITALNSDSDKRCIVSGHEDGTINLANIS